MRGNNFFVLGLHLSFKRSTLRSQKSVFFCFARVSESENMVLGVLKGAEYSLQNPQNPQHLMFVRFLEFSGSAQSQSNLREWRWKGVANCTGFVPTSDNTRYPAFSNGTPLSAITWALYKWRKSLECIQGVVGRREKQLFMRCSIYYIFFLKVAQVEKAIISIKRLVLIIFGEYTQYTPFKVLIMTGMSC